MFGQRIRKLRQARGLTMKELGQQLRLAESTISGYESESRKPDIEILHKLADYFEVNIDYILGRTDVPSPTKTTSHADNPAHSNVIYFRSSKEELDEDEARHLREQLEMYRAIKELKKKEGTQDQRSTPEKR
jgi:transcriptional regulator with XRE-family HTH domain